MLTRFGVEYDRVDQTDLEAVERAVRDDTRMVWVETPTNPTLKVVDIPAIVARAKGAFVAVDNTFATPVYQRPLELGADAAVRPETKLIWVETPTNPSLNVVDVEGIVARKGGAFVAVDNTFATPVYQRPLELGADAVVHSTTKYMGGHSDAVGGAVIVRDARAHEGMKFVQNSIGAVPGPFDCFLVHRGMRTLHLRMAAHTENARVVSAWLQDVEGVYDIRWPGLSGMVSFRHPEAKRIVAATRIFALAESLGGVESLIELPQAMTHGSVEGSAAAVPADLVRLSCGIEAAEDLVEDLAQAIG